MERCTECGKEFASEAALFQHLKDKHGREGTQAARPAPEAPAPVKKAKSLRKRNRHPVAIGIGAAAVVVILGLYFFASPYFAPPPFPYITGESYIHVHPWLQIWIDGKNVTIPCGVGTQYVTCNGGTYEPIHTHDDSGVLHIELSQSDASGHNYTLGDFFSIWKWTFGTVPFNGTSRPVVFTQTDILGFTVDATHHLYLLVDGKNSTAWGSLNLEQLDYCNASVGTAYPCQTANGNPYWDGGTNYPFGTGHKIVIEYVTA